MTPNPQGGLTAATQPTPTPLPTQPGKKSQLTSSDMAAATKAEKNRERAKRKKIRRFFKLSTQDIHKAAKKSGLTIKNYFQQLYDEMIEKRKNLNQDPWVEASFWQWVELGDKDHKKNTIRQFDGVNYVKTGNTRVPLKFIIPESVAQTWNSSDIEKLREISKKYPSVSSITDMLDCLVGGEAGSGAVILEFISKKSTRIPQGIVPPPTQAKNRNGVRHMVSKYCRTPVYPDFKPTFREQYVQPPFTQEGRCMWNCILNEYKEAWDNHFKKKKLTYETIAEIIGKEPGEACWDDFIPLFEKLKCNITMVNKDGVVEAKFEVPRDKRNKHICRTLTIVRHDAHTYWVQDTDMKKSIAHKEEKEDVSDFVSDKVSEVKPLEMNGCVKSLDELRLKALDCDADRQVYIWTGSESLNEVFEHLWFSHGVQANIDSFAGNFKSLTIPFGQKNLIIRVPAEAPHEKPAFDEDTTEEVFKRYEELMHEARLKFLDKSSKSGFLSRYSEDLMAVFRQALGCPLKGLFVDIDKDIEFIGLDQSKCYPYHLCQIKNIGVFCPLDKLRPYDGHTIEECSLYQFTNGEARFGVGVVPALGRPVSFIRPFKVKKNTLGGVIKKIMTDSLLSERQRKAICNIMIGQIGKATNRRCRFAVFENQAEALRFTEKYDDEPDPSMVREICDGKLWLAEIRNEGMLSEGFRVVQKMIYDRVRKHIDEFSAELKGKGIRVLGLNCDSVFVSKEDAEKLDFPFKYEGTVWDSMGKIKKELKKKGLLELMKASVARETIPATPIKKPVVYTLKDEWNDGVEVLSKSKKRIVHLNDDGFIDVDDIESEEIEVFERFNITSDVPGSGKTYLAVKYAQQKSDNFIVATFNNFQARDLMRRDPPVPATTVYKLCGARPGTEAAAKLEQHKYDTVIIDELGMHGSTARLMLMRYMEKNPTTQFIATEDLLQLEPIEGPDWNPQNKDWYTMVSTKLFPNNIHLLVPKRFGPEDVQKVKQLKTDLFVQTKSKTFKIDEYAHKAEEFLNLWTPESLFITYTNNKRHEVNEAIHKHLGFTDYYIRGQEYICKKRIKESGGELYISCGYKLLDFNDKEIILQDILFNEEISIKRVDKNGKDRLVKEILSLPYCKTCHSIQGSSVAGNVVLFETEHYCVKNNWLYVALTRARDLNKVYYVPGATERMDIEKIKRKCIAYQRQDKDAGRVVLKENRIWIGDILSLSQKQGHCCGRCHQEMNYTTKRNGEDWTVDRWDDSRGHEKGNCFLSHLSCNVGKIGDC